MGSKTTSSASTSPPASVLQNYQDVTSRAANVANTPYQAYGGELVAGINQGQSNAIGQLQQSYGVANPYINTGSSYLDQANSGLGGVQNYLQAGSQAAAQGQNYAGLAAGSAGPNAYQQYMNPYTQNVINSTMANAQQQDAIQQQQLSSNAIGQGAYGGDRAGVAQAALAGQQAMANNSTIAGLESSGYTNAQQSALQNAGLYGNLANSSNQSAGLYNSLGQTQGQTSQAYGALAGQAGSLGNLAQQTAIQGGSAALQASTLQQQNQQQQDTAAYGQFQGALQYPYAQTSFLSNIDEGLGSSSGSTTTNSGSALSQVAGAATTGLGILGATGAFGSSGYLTGASGLFSDRRLKEDVRPIGKTFSGQTMYSFRYKGDPSGTVHTGLMAQEVERTDPDAVHTHASGYKMVDYGEATDRAAERGHFARGGVPDGRPDLLDRFVPGTGLVSPTPPPGLAGGNQGMMRTSPFAGVGYHGGEARSVAGLTKSDNPVEASIARDARAARLRGAYADGGVAQAFATARSLRGGFDVGGAAGIGSIDPGQGLLTAADAPTGLNFAAPASWSGAALGGSSGPMMASAPRGGLAPAGSSTPAASPVPQSQAGLGALAASSAAPGVGSTNAGDPNDPWGSSDQGRWLPILAAGLGMMGGTSASAGANIGQGGLAGLQVYEQMKQQDRANALAQTDAAYKTGMLGLENRKEAFNENLTGRKFNAALGAAGALSGAAPGPVPGLAGGSPPSAPVSSGPDDRSASSVPATSPAPGSAPPSTPAGGSGFWSNVQPNSNPVLLNAQADKFLAAGQQLLPVDPESAQHMFMQSRAYRDQASKIYENGTAITNDGQVVGIPGYTATAAAKEGAIQTAKDAASANYDLVQVQPQPGGPTYSVPKSQLLGIQKQNHDASVIGPGAGSGPGSAFDAAAAQNPAITKQPEFFAQKQDAIAKDESSMADQFQQRQISKQRLQALSTLMQTYQTGAFSDVKADLVAQARAAGLSISDSDTANPAAFQKFVKGATANVFSDVKAQGGKVLVSEIAGLTKANANPDMQPAANAAIIGQGLGLINYEDQHYKDYTAWKAQPQNQYATSTAPFELPWVANNPVQTYVDAADKEVAAKGVPIPAAAQRTVGQAYVTPKGVARWMGNGWQKVSN